MGLADGAEERLIHRKALGGDSLIHRMQGFGELLDGLKLGHLGATRQGFQLIDQRFQLAAFAGMGLPMIEQIIGVEQDIHAFGQENADHLRVTDFAVFADHGFAMQQALLMQTVDFCD